MAGAPLMMWGSFEKKHVATESQGERGFLVEELHPSHSEFFFAFLFQNHQEKHWLMVQKFTFQKPTHLGCLKKNTLVQMMVDKPTNLNGLGRLFGDRSCAAGAYGAQPGIVGGLDAEGLSSGR